MKRCLLVLAVLMLFMSSCGKQPTLYETQFDGVFDTHFEFKAYAASEDEFRVYAEAVRGTLNELSKKYDIYFSYDGMNNLKTVNDSAGIAPVTVDTDIIELIEFSIEAYSFTGGTVNIALGAVLSVWRDSRDANVVPEFSALSASNLLTDISGVIVNTADSTIFLPEAGMSLDVGSTAKGFAAGKAVDAAKALGMTSGILNAGGNVITVGAPENSSEFWRVGIMNPLYDGTNDYIFSTVSANDKAVVTSGGYNRFYEIDGERFGHIIDPKMLMPAEHYAAVTVIAEGSGIADALSTALFILPVEEGKTLAEQFSAEAIWIFENGKSIKTDGF